MNVNFELSGCRFGVQFSKEYDASDYEEKYDDYINDDIHISTYAGGCAGRT